MLVKQISVFVENTPGRLATLTRTLADHGINIAASSIADTMDFGILRCIADDPEKAAAVLKEHGFTASTTRVLAVELNDAPGGLADILEYLSEGELDVEYVYSSVRSRPGKALILVKVDDPEKAVDILQKKGASVLCWNDIKKL